MDDEAELMREAEAYFEDEDAYFNDAQDDYEYEQDDDEEEEEEEEVKIPSPPPIVIVPKRVTPLATTAIPRYDSYFTKQAELGRRQINITLMNGDSRFCTMREATTMARMPLPPITDSAFSMHKIDSETFQRIESEVEYKIIHQEEEEEPPVPVATTRRTVKPNQPSRLPLVQRYTPFKFIDLLSHEKKNRDALRWLKSWDPKALKASAAASTEPNKRPSFHPKILLLTGSAGTGKTTLAHVIARHCNYRVVEINASDDRTAQSLKHHLENVTGMQAEVFDTARERVNVRKSLLVLDEVDGILDGIPLLVQYANDKTKTRPIICTCNDAFAAALRPLRQVSLVLAINLPARSRLVKRLKEILHDMEIKAVPGSLELLCERMEDDIRASLNALDFWINSTSKHATSELSRQSILTLPAFSKDSSRDLWQIWRELLTANSSSGGRGNALAKCTQDFFSVDTDVLVDGIHENFPAMRFVDSNFCKTLAACEWLGFVDVCQSRIRRDMDFSFQAYLPAACLGVGKSLGGASLQRKLQFPNSARLHRQQLMRNEETLQELTLQRDVASHLAQMMFPGKIRPGIPHQHLLPVERAEMDRISSLLQEYGVTWKEEEQGKWVMDPPVGDLARYVGLEDQPPFLLLSADLARSLNFATRKRKVEQQQPKPNNKTAVIVEEQAIQQPTEITVVPRRDFFGRVLAVQPQETLKLKKARNDFIFKFNEGFTDAVRRSLKIKDLV